MKNIKRVGNTIHYECEDARCPEDGKHSVSRDDLLATLYTVIEDLAMDHDLRIANVNVATAILKDLLYPEYKGLSHIESSDFVDSFSSLRQKLDAIADAMSMDIDVETAN
jgi:hypothetical protein